MDRGQLKRRLYVVVTLYLTFTVVRVLLSYCLAAIAPIGLQQPHEAEFYNRLSATLGMGPTFSNLLIGNSVFEQQDVFAAALFFPTFLSTLVFVALVTLLVRYREVITDDVCSFVFRWSIVIAVVSTFAVPVLAQDFWLSLGWGKMAAIGVNPYYADLNTQNLPIDLTNNLRMTYGPLWTLISTALVYVSGGNDLLSAVLFKVLLLVAWTGTLLLISDGLKNVSPFRRSLGIGIFGWLPSSMIEAISEGHNDIMVSLLLMLWLHLLAQRRVIGATMALTASVLIKYVTAPLFLLEVLYLFYSSRLSLRTCFIALISSAVFAGVVFATLFRSPSFFDSTSSMQSWHFYTPQEAILTFSRFGYLPSWIRYFPQIVLISIVFYAVTAFIRSRTLEKFGALVLAVVATVLFGFVGHVWEWFLVWVLPLAALVPTVLLSRWIIGIALAFPFATITLQFVQLSPFIRWELAGVLIYLFALFWLLLLPQSWLKQEPGKNATLSPVQG